MMNTKVFSGELAFVSGAVEKKSTIPIIQNILISQHRKAVTLTATNLEVGAVSAFRGDAGSIRTTVGAKMLQKAVASLKHVDDFDVTMGKQVLELSANGFNTSLATISPDSYPDLPTMPEDGGIPLPYEQLSSMLSAARHAISSEESRFTLNGCLLDLTKDTLRVVATDGHRLCIIEHPYSAGDKTLRFLVMNQTIPLIAKLAKTGNVLVCQHKDHEFFVACPADGISRVILQRRMTGSFPDHNRVLPKDFKYRATVNREELKRIVNQIIPMTDERSRCGVLTLVNTLGKSGLTVKASVSETGSAKATMGVGIKGPSGTIEIGLNFTYIIDALVAMKGYDEVTLCLEDPHKAAEIDGTVDGIPVREVIMPMRI